MSCHSQQANTEVGVEVVVGRPGDGGGDIPGAHGHLGVDVMADEKAEVEGVVGVDDIAYLAVEANTEGEDKHSAGDEDRPWAFREREAAYLVVVAGVVDVVVDVVEEVPDMEAEGGWGDGSPFLAREVDVESSEEIY